MRGFGEKVGPFVKMKRIMRIGRVFRYPLLTVRTLTNEAEAQAHCL
jgi:hypothetical protein